MKAKREITNIIAKQKYWKNIFDADFSPARMWLEGFGIKQPLNKTKHTHFFSSKQFSISEDIFANIHKLAQLEKFNVKTILISAYALLLHRMCANAEITFGITQSGNNSKSVNITLPILPIRSETHPSDTVREFIKKIDDQIKAQEHIDLFPKHLYERYLKKINYLFISKEELNTTNKDNITILPKFHPFLMLFGPNNTEKVELRYSANKFNKSSIKIIEEHFLIILTKLFYQFNEPITSVNILTPEEQKNLFHKWNAPKGNFNHHACIQDLIIESALKYPKNRALCHEDMQFSYKELENYSNQLGRFLIQEGVEPGNNVAILMERTPHLIIAILATLKVGATYVPINPRYSDERIYFILNDCKPRVILTNQTDRIPLDLQYRSLFYDKSTPLKIFSSKSLNIKVSPKQPAYIVYTIGKKGKPIGVMIKHESIVNMIASYKRYFKINSKDAASQFSSQGYDTFFCEVFPFLSVGASVHIIDDHVKLIPHLFFEWLEKHNITFCDLPTAYAQILFSENWSTALSLRLLKLGGERVTRLPSAPMNFDIWNTYGSTETTIECIIGKIYQANTQPPSKILDNTPPFIGKPIQNVEVYVVDSFKQPVPIGVAGQLLIGGVCIASGFYKREELTQENFIPNYFKEDNNEKLFKTQDLVRWLPSGNLEFIEKLEHQVFMQGQLINLNEIETAISQFPDVSEVIVAAKEMLGHPKILIAYLVPNLEKIRIPFHEPCFIQADGKKFIELITEDISKEGLAISGLTQPLPNKLIKINFKLPGMREAKCLQGHVAWQTKTQAGIRFEINSEDKSLLHECIQHFLLTHNLMDVLYNVASKRNLRNALSQRLPDFMVPSIINILPNLPLTFNGKIDWKALPTPYNGKFIEKHNIKPKTSTEKKLTQIWCDILNIDEISMTDNFFELGGTSYTASQFLIAVEKEFNIILTPHVLIDLPYIPIIAEFIDTNAKQYTQQSFIQQQMRHDLVLAEDITPVKHTPTPVKNILITGASSFLGIFILNEVLKQTDAKVYCLVRAELKTNTLERFMYSLTKFNLNNQISLDDRRISLISSDIGAHNLGLSTDQYNRLSEQVDVIYHCGAHQDLSLPYTSLRNINVIGTGEIIRFAAHRKAKLIHFASTIAAATKVDSVGNYLEDFPTLSEAPHLVGGYVLSKWVSERLLTEIKNRGLVVNIFRIGRLIGSSTSGAMELNDAFLDLLKGCIQLGFAPDWHEKITFLPIDFVSKSFVALSLHHSEKSHVFHLEDPHGIMWQDLISWINEYGYPVKIISEAEWRKKLLEITPLNALYPLLSYYLTPRPLRPEIYMQHTSRILEQLNLSFPRVENGVLKNFFDFLREVGFLGGRER